MAKAKVELKENERLIEFQGQQFVQILLPVRQALMLKQHWIDKNGDINELKLYDAVLKNCFREEYKLEDFGTNVPLVDHITAEAVSNQYTTSGK